MVILFICFSGKGKMWVGKGKKLLPTSPAHCLTDWKPGTRRCPQAWTVWGTNVFPASSGETRKVSAFSHIMLSIRSGAQRFSIYVVQPSTCLWFSYGHLGMNMENVLHVGLATYQIICIDIIFYSALTFSLHLCVALFPTRPKIYESKLWVIHNRAYFFDFRNHPPSFGACRLLPFTLGSKLAWR